ncbi:MAG: hypothetical protein KF782_34350 [Labilithrix sp.]|nr:hypothetical protein [Labilithrix sp.]
MRTAARATVLAFVALVGAAAGCADEPVDVPVRPAPPSRHDALVDALADDARAFAFADGDWEEDLGDAPFYGLAWLARRAAAGELDAEGLARRDAALAHARSLVEGSLLEGDVQDKVMAALGMIEYVGASGDRSVVPAIDDFVDRLDALTRTLGDYIEAGADRSWALRTYGPTAVTALVALVQAQHALLIGGERAGERIDRVVAIDAKIRERALTDLADVATGRQARGYAFAPGQAGLYDYPNLAMLLLKARLFRLTKREEFRLEARAVYVALQPLKLADAPARYASPYARASLGVDTRDVSTLSSQNYLTLGLLLLFEITGDQRFVDEADRMLDGVAAMRGPWCASDVRDPAACAPACASGQACVAGGCSADRCTTGLLHHVIDGRLATAEDGTLFCSGCNLQTLYVAGYRRALAGEAY